MYSFDLPGVGTLHFLPMAEAISLNRTLSSPTAWYQEPALPFPTRDETQPLRQDGERQTSDYPLPRRRTTPRAGER